MTGKELASFIKFRSDYNKWMDDENRLENWEDAAGGRVMGMHRNNPRFAEAFKDERFKSLFEKSVKFYNEKKVLASQRALQYAAEPILKKNARQYNCSATYIDRPRAFQEIMWVLLCGAGVGYSIQKKDTLKLPEIGPRTKGTKTFVVEDTIEGWADALGVLLSSYFLSDQPFPEYAGYEIRFDFSLIRPKGSFISGGFKAPGHEGLKKSLELIELLINKTLAEGVTKLRPIHVHDIICYSADAVISGGVRRSALIAMFDKDDTEMIKCKTGNWNETNPQRARANNSAVLVKGQFTEEEFNAFKEYIKEFGEPGFILVDSDRFVYNPCAEIGFYCYSPVTQKSGFSFCNLNEINGAESNTPELLCEQAEVAAFIGTLQAAYDKFDYLGTTTEEIVQAEALLGISITGWMNNPNVLFNGENLKKAAKIVLDTNEWVAKLIGINPCARGTCVKPSGNSSVILGCASGIGAEHARRYFRLMQLNKQSDILKAIKEIAPTMVEHSVWSSIGADDVVYVPVEVSDKTITKKEISGVQFLEYVKLAKIFWVNEGKVAERCLHPDLSHNVSNTVTVDNWDDTFDFIYENKEFFSGVSFMSDSGDKSYNQAPFTEVLNAEEIFEKYGDAALFASGLIVDGLNVFDNLWDALNLYVKGTTPLIGTRTEKLLMKDWIRRVKQFAKRYVKNDLNLTIELLLDVNNWHRWNNIKRELKRIDPSQISFKPEYLEIADLTSNSCYGGACEIPVK